MFSWVSFLAQKERMTSYWETKVLICNPPFRKSDNIHNTLYSYNTVRNQTQPKTPFLRSLALKESS
jgi:hypothetical protein